MSTITRAISKAMPQICSPFEAELNQDGVFSYTTSPVLSREDTGTLRAQLEDYQGHPRLGSYVSTMDLSRHLLVYRPVPAAGATIFRGLLIERNPKDRLQHVIEALHG